MNDVQIFVAAAEAQTLTAAARTLHVPASMISRAVSRLEKRLQVTFAREILPPSMQTFLLRFPV